MSCSVCHGTGQGPPPPASRAASSRPLAPRGARAPCLSPPGTPDRQAGSEETRESRGGPGMARVPATWASGREIEADATASGASGQTPHERELPPGEPGGEGHPRRRAAWATCSGPGRQVRSRRQVGYEREKEVETAAGLRVERLDLTLGRGSEPLAHCRPPRGLWTGLVRGDQPGGKPARARPRSYAHRQPMRGRSEVLPSGLPEPLAGRPAWLVFWRRALAQRRGPSSPTEHSHGRHCPGRLPPGRGAMPKGPFVLKR